jgi:hypothetical protein
MIYEVKSLQDAVPLLGKRVTIVSTTMAPGLQEWRDDVKAAMTDVLVTGCGVYGPDAPDGEWIGFGILEDGPSADPYAAMIIGLGKCYPPSPMAFSVIVDTQGHKCTGCSGTGREVLFSTVGVCRDCHGTGVTP